MKRLTSTVQIELVETHNLLLSLKRLRDAAPYDSLRWKRAFYHALGMTDLGRDSIEKIRLALELP